MNWIKTVPTSKDDRLVFLAIAVATTLGSTMIGYAVYLATKPSGI